MMKFYFMKTDAGNQVVITDENTAKVFDGAPNGIVEGVDLYANHAALDLKEVYSELDKDGLMNDYENICCEFVVNYEDIKEELEECAELIYKCA